MFLPRPHPVPALRDPPDTGRQSLGLGFGGIWELIGTPGPVPLDKLVQLARGGKGSIGLKPNGTGSHKLAQIVPYEFTFKFMKTIHINRAKSLLAAWATLLGGAFASVAADQVTQVSMVPLLKLSGTVGATVQIQYSTNLTQMNWVALTNLVVPQPNYYFVDQSAPAASGRFYRVTRLSPQGMALVPSGAFVMGDLDGSYFAVPLHTVTVSAFAMDQNPVTKAQWDSVKTWSGGNGYTFDNAGSGKAPTHPVQGVNWWDCVKWCNARSEMEGRTPCYYNDSSYSSVFRTGTNAPYVKWDASGYRLPTEAEWERAARGGIDGQRFPWGNTISWSNANYYASPSSVIGGVTYDVNATAGSNPVFNDGTVPYTSPVGSFPANTYGLFDMVGNVWEWCWDWYGDYTSAAQTDPHGPASGDGRVYRAGSWSSQSPFCRVAARYGNPPATVANALGFRCVVSAGL